VCNHHHISKKEQDYHPSSDNVARIVIIRCTYSNLVVELGVGSCDGVVEEVPDGIMIPEETP
jgi:hypothetical protein